MLRCVLLWVTAAFSLAYGQTIDDHDQVVACYVATWSVYRPSRGAFTLDDVNPMLCTHIMYAFLGIDEKTFRLVPLDPEYDINKGGFDKARALRRQNQKLKVLIAIGGWTEGSEKYSAMASNETTRKSFINSIVDFISKHDFDGIDLDWEYPANRGGRPNDKENFVQLLKELRVVCDRKGWVLTAAVGAGKNIIDSAYDIVSLGKYLDYMHLMAYDYHGSWDMKTGHNAPLYARIDETDVERTLNVNFSVKYYLTRGAPLNKFVLGLGLYGRTYLLNNTANPGIGAPTRKSSFAGPYTREDGFLGYNEICEKLVNERTWSLTWQKAHQAPYMFRDNMWVSFDDVNSLAIKVAYAQRLGLAGVMVWSMDTDDFNAQCGSRYPLLSSINRNLALHAKDRFKDKVPKMTPSELDQDKPGPPLTNFDLDDNDLDKARYDQAVDRRPSGADSFTSTFTLVFFLGITTLLG